MLQSALVEAPVAGAARRSSWGARLVQHDAATQGRGPTLSGRSLVAAAVHQPVVGARLDHRRDRRCPEPRLGRPSRRRLARDQREGDDAHSAVGRPLLSGGAVRSSSSTRRACSSRAGADLAQGYAWPQSPGGSRSTRRATSGLPPRDSSQPPATPARGRGDAVVGEAPRRRSRPRARRRRRAGPADAHVLKFSRDGKFLLQIGTPGKMDGPDSQTTLNRPSAIAVRRRRQRGVRRRHRQPPHRRVRRGHRRLQAPLVRVRREGRGRRRRTRTRRAIRRRSRSATSRASRSPGTAGLRLRSQQQPHPGVPQGRHVREGRRRRRRTRSARPSPGSSASCRRTARRGTWRSRTTRSSATCSWPTATTRRCTSCSATRWRRSARFGSGGRYPGQFLAVGSIAVDAQGNVYTGEQHHGKRVQKFVRQRRGYGGDHEAQSADRWRSFLAVLGGARRRAEHRAASRPRRRRRARVDGAAVRGRSDVPEAAAERLVSGPDDRPVGRRAGSRLDRASARRARRRRRRVEPDAADRRVLQHRADPILEFDQAGNLLRHWGGKDGPGYQWPDSNHGLNIDNKGNIWIGGNGAMDGHVLKFTLDGKFVMQVGQEGRDPRQPRHGSLLPGRQDVLLRDRPTRCSWPTATATGASP